MSDVRPFPTRLVRPAAARRTVTAMSESQDDSGVALYGVTIDPASYEECRAALYVYRQRRGDASYTGVVCDVAVQAIADGRVHGHEAIHQLRVDALLWHHARSETPPALVMLLHREGPEFLRAVEEAQQREPVLDFEGPHGFQQTVWRVGDEPTTSALAAELAGTDLYIADGHHRTAGLVWFAEHQLGA